jgi:hypothetical protein
MTAESTRPRSCTISWPIYTGQFCNSDLGMVNSYLASFIFLEADPAKYVILGEKAVGHIHDLADIVKDHTPSAGSRVSVL